MKVSAIVTSHNNPDGLVSTVKMLKNQRHAPYEIIALISDTILDHDQARYVYANCDVVNRPNMNDWGHDKRAMGLELALGDLVGFFNDDDTYSSKYIEKLVAKVLSTGAKLVACDFVSHLAPGQINLTEPVVGRITSGNFLVQREIAQQVGYKHKVYEADGLFIEDVMDAGATFARVPEVLYVHN